MEDVIQDPKMKEFVESPVSSDFGLSVEEVAEQVKSYGRFSAWLNGNVSQIVDVLNIVKEQGVSPAFFGAYEYTEGYNEQWGWLNHTSPAGDPFQDAESVATWVEDQSNSTEHDPAWIDYANYKDFVPDDVKQAGNEHFAGLPTGTIGRVVIAGTAAATWEVYYPNGLKKEYNGVQDYGAPINNMIDAIESWGGEIGEDSGSEPDPDDPSPDPPADPIIDIDFTPITNFYDDVTGEITSEIERMINNIISEFEQTFDQLLEEIEKMLSVDLYNYGKSYTKANNFIKLTKQLENMHKIKPTKRLFDLLNEIIDEGIQRVNDQINAGYDRINNVISSGTDLLGNIIDSIEPDVSYPEPDDPDPDDPDDPPSDGLIVFPVDYNASGINFWSPPHSSDLEHNMDYGERTSGRFHYGFDIGGGGVNHDIYAVTDGEVTMVQTVSGYGYSIQIKHDNDEYYSYYAHLVDGSSTVSVGDHVSAGQKIAVMGASGGNYAIHLHFELSRNDGLGANGDTIDPKDYLGVTDDNTTSLPNPTKI